MPDGHLHGVQSLLVRCLPQHCVLLRGGEATLQRRRLLPALAQRLLQRLVPYLEIEADYVSHRLKVEAVRKNHVTPLWRSCLLPASAHHPLRTS